MENKTNIAEILKDCPKGMELDCLLYDNVTFERYDVEQNRCYFKAGPADTFWTTCYGKINGSPFSKCVIYPKGKTTWEGFQRPFKDGDILFVKSAYNWVFIYKESENKEDLHKYAATPIHPNHTYITYDNNPLCYKRDVSEIRLATEEEKEKLFHAIKNNGYNWNEETKTLEKFTPDKFDINTLKPFDKVLVRHNIDNKWCSSFFSHIDSDFHSNCYKYVTVAGKSYPMCIPYEKNEHLLGTTNDCDEYFKNWE